MFAIHVSGGGVSLVGAGAATKVGVDQLASTGVSHTVFMLVPAGMLVVAGLLALGAARRHDL